MADVREQLRRDTILADHAFVARQRGLRASWAAIAAMIGRSIHDTRWAFDLDYNPPLDWTPPRHAATVKGPRPPQPTPAKARPYRPVAPVDASGAGAAVLAAVLAGARTPFAVGLATGRTAKQATNVLHTLKRRGLLDARQGGGNRVIYTATAHGVRDGARIAAEQSADRQEAA